MQKLRAILYAIIRTMNLMAIDAASVLPARITLLIDTRIVLFTFGHCDNSQNNRRTSLIVIMRSFASNI